MPATIELRARDIKTPLTMPFMGHPQHGYIIHTASNGIRHIIRSGPSNDDMLNGDLVVDYVRYDDDIQGLAKSDYITDPKQYRTVTLYKGDDLTAANYMGKIWEYGHKINIKSPDYKLPLCDLVNFGYYNLRCSQGNSNTFIEQALKHAKLTFKSPTYEDGEPVWMPGLKSEIRDTIIDHVIDYGGRYSDLTIIKAKQLYSKYVENRKSISGKAMGTFKMAESLYGLNKHSGKIIDLYKEFEQWQQDSLDSMAKNILSFEKELENQANIECQAKGVKSQQYTICTPSTPGAVEIKVDIDVMRFPNYFCANNGNYQPYCSPNIHITKTHYWHCNIKIPCDEIRDKYQLLFDTKRNEFDMIYNDQKQVKQKQINDKVDALLQTIDKAQATIDLTPVYNDIRIKTIGEINGLKNALLDEYGIDHEVFA